MSSSRTISLVTFLLLIGSANAQTLTVINPEATGEGAVSVAAGLAARLDQGLLRAPKFRRVGADLLPGELNMVFGCVEYEVPCARQAAAAAETELVLFAKVERVGVRFDIDLALVWVEDGRFLRRIRRTIRQQGNPTALSGGVDLALGMMVNALLAEEAPAVDSGIVLPGTVAATSDAMRFPAPGGTSVAAGEVALNFANRGRERVVVAPGEIVVVATPTPAAGRGVSPLGMAAWMTAGASVVALGGAGYFGVELARNQADYESARDPETLLSLRETGSGSATATTALLITGGAAALISAVLFVLDSD